MMQAKRCPNDNHGRMVVRIRFCPSCGEVLNRNIVSRTCPEDTHVKLRRSRNSYCMDCGTGLLEERRRG